MYKILLVEDDPSLCQAVGNELGKWGFDVVFAADFSNILKQLIKEEPHLVIMDINLPYYDGFYWCQSIRKVSKVPLIFISSRDSNMDIIMAMNMGGDDFVTKPVSVSILVAKINALLRRTYSYRDDSQRVIEHGGVILNLWDNSVLYQEKKIHLTRNEFTILLLLMQSQGKIVSRDKLMRVLWEDESFVDDNTLTVNVNRLRSKLSSIGVKDLITTKKSQGYVIL